MKLYQHDMVLAQTMLYRAILNHFSGWRTFVKLQWAFGSTYPEVIARIAEADHSEAGNDKQTPCAEREPGIRGREIKHTGKHKFAANAGPVNSVVTPGSARLLSSGS